MNKRNRQAALAQGRMVHIRKLRGRVGIRMAVAAALMMNRQICIEKLG